MKHIYNNLEINLSAVVGYVRKYQFQNIFVFTIQEYSEWMSPHYAASLCNIAVSESALQTADLGPITLENALVDMSSQSMTSRLIVSDILAAGNIIIRYAEDRTLTAPFKEFEMKVGSIIEVEVVNISALVLSELESSRISSDRSVRNASINIDTVNRLQNSTATSMIHTLTHALDALSIARDTMRKVDETKLVC